MMTSKSGNPATEKETAPTEGQAGAQAARVKSLVEIASKETQKDCFAVLWENYGKRRLYIKYRVNGKEKEVGWVDLDTGKWSAGSKGAKAYAMQKIAEKIKEGL